MTKTESMIWKAMLRQLDESVQSFAVAVRDFVDDSMKQIEKEEANAKHRR